ncbi:hypothetical protein NLG97_g8533 [Lecanicillium saksenae]|uniref:Uncharacterized protein n=1 Tax=Lecanicillium saksenae TaxID=468837 RepID=A0ACC1QL99_9HYPO|nr:hypothetical protein NLG97_g8533 [Lecanicillium saksenae]
MSAAIRASLRVLPRGFAAPAYRRVPAFTAVQPLRSQCLRQMHASPRLLNQAEQKDKAEADKAKPEKPEESEKTENSENAEGEEAKSEGKEGEGKEKEGKKEEAPPPPHGDKTPWQVFMETMNTEFQASKEWNESTKQIGAAAHQFSESESVKRAREAYEKSTGAVSSTAASAIKSTAGAIGKGASWTWETPVMKAHPRHRGLQERQGCH